MKSKEELLSDLRDAFVNIDSDKVHELLKKAIEEGVSPRDIIERAIRQGADEVGRKYEACEYFLPELVMSGEMMKEAIEVLKPLMQAEGATSSGKVSFGTVKGDLHDIGKNIVISMLSVAGFDVYDLGVDVPPERFVSEVRDRKPDILCMSSLLTHTMPEMKLVIDELKKNGLREKVKVMVGGRPVTQEYADSIEADSYGRDAYEAVLKAKQLMSRE
ncbi:MAG: corrinoid protein [Candidatus Bathyarchaeia archaeon]